MMKRLMSLLLCIVLVLAVLPLGIQAAETEVPEGHTRVYCQAPTSWSDGKVYWWGSSDVNPDWPGVDMRCNSDGIWYYDVPNDVSGLIFNDGNGYQTADLQLPTGEQNMFAFASGQWTAYGTAVIVGDYFVAGVAGLCGVEWIPDVPENKMQDEDQDGVYTINYTNVAAGTYEFKVTNGTWDQSWGYNGGVDNYQLTVANDQTELQIKFYSTTCWIEVVILSEAPAPVEPDEFFMNLHVEASLEEVQVGDTVDFTVYAFGNGITALQFNLIIPNGMSYVAGSGAVPENLRETMGWGAMDWTEETLMWTGFNDLPTAFAENTAILTFSCVAEEVGSYQVAFYGALPFDENFEERIADVTVEPVDVVEKTTDPVAVPTLALKAPALEFKDMICVIAFYTAENIDDVVEMGMLTYTEKVDVVDVNTAAHVIPGATYDPSSGRYFSSSQGIHAKYLGDTVYLACYAKLTDGSYVYTKLASYGPLTYAKNQLDKSSDVKLKQLCAAMLNYGAAAQVYFGYNTDVLANSTLSAEQIALPETYNADMAQSAAAISADKQGTFTNNKGFSVRKPAVSFEGAFSINYFFTPAYTPVDGITLYYWTEADANEASVLTIENATGAIAMTDEGTQFRGDIEGIAAKDLSKAVYVAAVYSDGTSTWTSGVLGYSIGAYCASMAKGTDAMADLAMATAVYGYHAKAYFG